MKARWTRQAQSDLRLISDYIRQDSVQNARRFIRRVQEAVAQLSTLPESGGMLPEVERPTLRQIFVAQYRIVYELRCGEIFILTVLRGARDWPGDDFAGD